MYAMQYTIQLPADYDMQIIRDRVARTGHLLDGYPGLQLKAYLVCEKAAGAPGNEYAPFYLWRDLDGMRSFCWGEPGYSAIVRDFGRHAVHGWLVAGTRSGPVEPARATTMTITRHELPAGAAPSATVPALADDFLAGATADTVRRVVAVDVTSWTAITADLGASPMDQAAGDVYEVLHVSPGAEES